MQRKIGVADFRLFLVSAHNTIAIIPSNRKAAERTSAKSLSMKNEWPPGEKNWQHSKNTSSEGRWNIEEKRLNWGGWRLKHIFENQ